MLAVGVASLRPAPWLVTRCAVQLLHCVSLLVVSPVPLQMGEVLALYQHRPDQSSIPPGKVKHLLNTLKLHCYIDLYHIYIKLLLAIHSNRCMGQSYVQV